MGNCVGQDNDLRFKEGINMLSSDSDDDDDDEETKN